VICLDCGKEFSYNWEEMRIVAAEPLADWGIRRIGASLVRIGSGAFRQP
jgi:hypothetical protein